MSKRLKNVKKYVKIMILMIITLSMIYWQLSYGVNKTGAITKRINTPTVKMEWNNTFGGSYIDLAYSLIQTSDGGFAMAGYTEASTISLSNMLLVKTDVNGELEWNKVFGGKYMDEAYSLIQTSDGGFAMAGKTTSYGAGYPDMWLVKTDVNGELEWNNTFGGIDFDWAESLIQTSDGGFALAGCTKSYGAGNYDMWLVKTDTNGEPEWNNTFGGIESDGAYSLIQTSDGGFALAGFTNSYGAGGVDMWLVKTDTTGNHEWDYAFGELGTELATSLIQTSDGGLALAGYTSSYGAGNYDMWLVKTDITGISEWKYSIGGEGKDEAYSLIQTTEGGFAIAGYTESYGAGNYDMWLVKTDDEGELEWKNTFGGTENDFAQSLVQTTDGGFAIAGSTNSYGDGDINMWLVKTLGSTANTLTTSSTTTVASTTTHSETSPSWAPIIVILSLATIIIRKRG